MKLKETIISFLLTFIIGCAALTQYGMLTNKGDDAKMNGRHQTAIEYYLQALKTKPGYEPAIAGLETSARSYYDEQMQDIRSMQDAGNWKDATEQTRVTLRLLKQVRVHDVNFPTSREIQELETMLSSGNQQLAERSYSLGMASSEKQDYRSAMSEFSECLNYAGNYKDVSALKEKARYGLAKQIYDQGEQAADTGDWHTALERFKETVSIMPDYEGVNQRIRMAEEGIAEKEYQKALDILSKAGNVVSVKPYREAMVHLETCLSYVPDYKDAAMQYQQAKEKAVARIVILPFECSTPSVGDALTQQIITNAVQQRPEMITFVDRQYISSFLLSERGLVEVGVLNAQNVMNLSQAANVHGIVAGKVFIIRTDKPEETINKTGNYREQYTDSQGVTRSSEKTFSYELHTKVREMSIQVSYQLISAETGAIVAGESLSDVRSDYARWVAAQQRFLDLAAKAESEKMTTTMEPKSLDVLQQEAVQSLSRQLANRIVSNVGLLIR